jgi:hypothetical protein
VEDGGLGGLSVAHPGGSLKPARRLITLLEHVELTGDRASLDEGRSIFEGHPERQAQARERSTAARLTVSVRPSAIAASGASTQTLFRGLRHDAEGARHVDRGGAIGERVLEPALRAPERRAAGEELETPEDQRDVPVELPRLRPPHSTAPTSAEAVAFATAGCWVAAGERP